ncbi:GPP34 family phosphoprotein [Streptomyces sp. WAC04114]|uniref:GPP34 family phosphoprotein n=1 Tax=Streptomyces sp. WAC04114 TaxID=2867961 RepID=UPI001C8B2649|nr:GPP34 family phosphoprotein [Streptomyces sp. WAC04114]MBX9360640.1 GPP34 family phosphoprotein [Streptomyces sp. WAC04114]
MGTARDLMIVAMDGATSRLVTQGDLSLGLAGAEVFDLLAVEAMTLDDDRIVPRLTPSLDDPLLEQAAAGLVRDKPYETVEDWLWHRGRGLAERYLTVLTEEGLLARPRASWLPFRDAAGPTPVDSPARQRARDRRAADEPVLTTLAAAVGARDDAPEDLAVPHGSAQIVFAAVVGAVTELDAVRRRRAVENAAFANVWRGA